MPELTQDLDANFEQFIETIKVNKVVWGLQSAEGWAVCPSNEYEDATVFPFWSEKAYVVEHCIEEWSEYTPSPIDLDSFIDNWLDGMNEDTVLVGPNWNADLDGLEIEPLEVAELLSDEESSE